MVSSSPGPWRELGRDLRRLHYLEVPSTLGLDPPLPVARPEDLLDARLADGWVSSWTTTGSPIGWRRSVLISTVKKRASFTVTSKQPTSWSMVVVTISPDRLG